MDLVGDRRGQSIQIGAVLLFGVLIIAFSSYQAFVVPNQNRGVEYNHNQQVQSDMQDLRNAIVSVPGSTSSQAVSVELSTRYPTRLVARNPSQPSGTLRTNGTTDMRYNLTVRNAAADGETGDIWNGTARPYNTGTIAYSPNYNLYTNAPTTYYEQSVAYNRFRTANLTLTEQAIVDGRDITLVALNGSLRRSSGGSTSVDIRPVSRSDDPIIVSNDTATTNVSVSVPTRLPESKWEELLSGEIDDNPGDTTNDKYIADVTTTEGPGPYDNLTITFERGADYRLRMAKAGVGNGVSSEGAAYLTDVRGDGSKVSNDTTTDLVLEVRDEYNNPVQGVTVNGTVNATSDGSLAENKKQSGNDGQVAFEYDANGVTPGTQGLNFSYRGLDGNFDGEGSENVTMEVEVTSSISGSGSGSGGGSGVRSVYYESGGPVSVIKGDGTITPYTSDSEFAKGLSRVVDIDSDSENEVVYADGSANLVSTSPGEGPTTLVPSNNVRSGNIGVGDWDNDTTTEIIYVGNDDKLYQYEMGGSKSVIQNNQGNGQEVDAIAVAGIGDFDTTTDGLEVVYTANNGKITYLSKDGGTEQELNPKPNTGAAVSQPADFDGDSTLEVAYTTGNNGNIRTVDRNNSGRLIDDVNALESPLGAVDWNGDGDKDIVYADSNNQELLYYDVAGTDGSTYIKSNGRISIAQTAGTS